jgi:hypothetical protein
VRWIRVRLINCLPDYPSHPSAVSRTGSRLDVEDYCCGARCSVGECREPAAHRLMVCVCTSKQSSKLSDIRRCCKVTASTALCCATYNMLGRYGILPCGLQCYSEFHMGCRTRPSMADGSYHPDMDSRDTDRPALPFDGPTTGGIRSSCLQIVRGTTI